MRTYMVSETDCAIAHSWADLVLLGESGFRAVSKLVWDKKRAELQNQTSASKELNLDRANSLHADL